ncbi:MAG: glycosyltransferase family 2 protein [Halobacteriales archaeon]|nr:glycosyltransferase family 2 protein [Halobacteriales archaeon]
MVQCPRSVELLASLGGIVVMFALGLVTGVDVWTVSVEVLSTPFVLVFFEGTVSVAIFTLVVTVTGLVVVYDVWGGTDTEAVHEGPEVCAVVPVYRDAEVLDVSVGSLLESEYENLSVAVVTEPDDPETQRRARELAEEHDEVDVLVNGEPGSKGTAINHAVGESDADYFAVFDADERVSPEFVPGAMGELLDGADVFQGRRVPRAIGPVETLAYCERLVVHAGYAFGELFGFTNCLSASTLFTREAFETVGGYDDNLTEDIEFAHACNNADLSIVHDRSVTNSMEAPHTYRDLWGQRKRWRIGHVQVFQSRVRELFDGDVRLGELNSVGRASGAIMGGALLLVVMAHIAVLVSQSVEGAAFASAPFGVLFVVLAAVWAKDARDGRIGLPSWTVVFAPTVYLLHGALTVKSLTEYYLTWEGEWYQVAKTGS